MDIEPVQDEHESEREEGRGAADRLCDAWPDTSWIPAAPSREWAEAALARFGELMRNQPAIFKASQRGAEAGAGTLSPRRFQGIAECLQNADDLGATELRVALRPSPRRELLIVHDGAPVSLANAGAMLLPWLSTKVDDPQSSGRFGIGQKTLNALGGPLEIHCPPFHFAILDDGPQFREAVTGIAGVFRPEVRETLIVIPLKPEIDDAGVATAVAALGVASLVFLRTVRRLTFTDLAHPDDVEAYTLNEEGSESLGLRINSQELDVEFMTLRQIESSREIPLT